jgi:outer membrane protein OmpA-like peptidoglycan-associated protein
MMKFSRALLAITIPVVLGACATSKSVDEKIAASQATTNQKIESVSSQVEDLQQKQTDLTNRQTATDARVEQLSQSAAEALKRAEEAGVLAKGQVVFEQTFSEDRVKFKLSSSDLTGLTSAYFIEIQGHTDDSGAERYNEELGQRRAESVRRYLSREHKLPLNRMSTISYGDTLPLESNRTRAGRAANRRVVMVVLE